MPLTTSRERGKIKGAAFREFVSWWQRTRGDAAVREAHARLPAALAEGLDPGRPALGILPSTWYPAEVTHAIVDGLIEPVPRAQWRSIADEGAIAVMAATVSGVYKAAFALLVSPPRYAKHAQRIWNMHYDSGTSMFEAVEPNVYRSTIADWHAHHEFICMLNMAATIPIFGAMGCHDVRYEVTECVSNGGTTCRSTVSWR